MCAPERGRQLTTGAPSTRVSGAGRGTAAALRRGVATAAAPKAKTAVVLMNLGGPATLEEVHPFLLRLFSDRDLIPLPFQANMAKFIARRRTPRIQAQYAQIGGGSPIRSWTEKQASGMVALLDQLAPATAPHKPYIAFRYAAPLTDETVTAMLADGVERAVAFTQYPQYSCSTTGSSLNELRRQVQRLDPKGQIAWSVIDRWPTYKPLIEAFHANIQKALATFPEAVRKDVVLLFSAHSLPMSVVNRGDPYPAEVAATVNVVMERLQFSHPYRVVWQSQVGPSAWLGPQTSSALQGLGRNGYKNVLLIPVAFTSDHIETLFELDIEYGHKAKEWGIENLRRMESFNDGAAFVRCLAELAAEHLAGARPTARQLYLRCPGCTNDSCRDTKTFFQHQRVSATPPATAA